MKKAVKKFPHIIVFLAILIAGIAVAAFASYANAYHTVKVEYKYSDNSVAHDPYVAVLHEGSDVDLTVNNPVIPGYKAVDSLEEGAADAKTTTIDIPELTEDYEAVIYYVPDLVHYKVRYFLQNINDDLYTEELTLSSDYYEKTGYTGTYPNELEQIEFDGFTSLFHEPDAIAADGSTTFKLYYDRDYTLVDFDLGEGGYGVEPVYAKQGSTFNISTPKRIGYEFLGWCKANANGDYVDNNGKVITDQDTIEAAAENFSSGIVPKETTYYKAVWDPQSTKYSIVYWIQNPDSTLTTEEMSKETTSEGLRTLVTANYSVVVAKDFENVPSNTEVYYDDMVANQDFFYTNTTNKTNRNLATEFPSMSAAQLTELNGEGKFFNLNTFLTKKNFKDDLRPDMKGEETLPPKTIKGDGTTRINVYYDREDFNLMFFYAREKLVDGEPSGKISLTNSTKGFSKSNYYGSNNNNYLRALAMEDDKDNAWANDIADSLPHLQTKYTDPSSPDYIPGLKELYKDYTYAKDSTKGNAKKGETYRYYYYQVSAKYGAPLDGKWLVDPVTSVHRKGKGAAEMCISGSWAVENGTNYHDSHTTVNNFTIKGFYEKLGNELMFNSSKTTDYTELHYLVSWTNTGGSGWNYGINRVLHFKYENYTELLPKETVICQNDPENGPASVKASGGYEKVRSFVTKVNGVTKTKWYGLKEDNIINTIDSGDQYDRNKGETTMTANVRANQTSADITGFRIENYNPPTDTKIVLGQYNTEVDWSEDTANDRHATVRFFYRRLVYTLKFRNGNNIDREFDQSVNNGVAYGVSLNKKDADGNYIYYYVPEYTINPDLKDYYEFDGWYYTPYYYRQVDFNTETMPADDLTLYAKWKPVTNKVTFYNDYKQYSRGTKVRPGQENPYILHEVDVDYDAKIDTPDVPSVGSTTHTLVPPDKNHTANFAGWYYLDKKKRPVRFDPETIPVTEELILYAEWVSEETAKYRIRYVEKGTDNDVATPTTGTVFVSKTKTFTAKSSTELDEAHKWSADHQNWWPTLSSHSILVTENDDGEEYAPNEFKFEYFQKDKVWYEVKYIDATTGRELLPAGQTHADHQHQTNYAAVTEKAPYIQGYVASELTQSMVLAASTIDTSTEEGKAAAKAEELNTNVITFLYTPSDTATLYQINYYVQDTDGTDSYELHYTENKTAQIDDVINLANQIYNTDTANQLASSGYSLASDKTTVEVDESLVYDTEPAEEGAKGGTRQVVPENVTLTGAPTIFSVYFNRNSYNYTVKYVDYEAEYKHDHEGAEWNGQMYETTVTDPDALVGKTINISAPDKYQYNHDRAAVADHYSRISDRQLTLVIRPDKETPEINVIKVYYKKDSQKKLTYEIACDVEADETFATLSRTREAVETQEEISGCEIYFTEPADLNGEYEFLGWFSTPDPIEANRMPGTTSATHKYVPELPVADMTYYAVFKQKTVSITVDVMYNNSGVYDPTDTDDLPILDNNGIHTGHKINFDSPHGYISGNETPVAKNHLFEFSADRYDSRLYKYEFAGWYSVDSDGFIHRHYDIVTTNIKNLHRDRDYHYIAMFKRSELLETMDYEIKYQFRTRSNGVQNYVVQGTLTGSDLADNLNEMGAYELTDEFILARAPYESNHGETLTWTDTNISKTSEKPGESREIMRTVAVANQSTKKAYVHYKLNPDGEYLDPIETVVGANYKSDTNLLAIDVSDIIPEGKEFDYWEVKKTSDGKAIAKCSDTLFSMCIMDSYWISPVFKDSGITTKTAKLDPKSIALGNEDWLAWTWNTDKDGIVVTPDSELNFSGLKNNVIFARVAKGVTELGNDWTNVWNQTGTLEVKDGQTYSLTRWGDDKHMYGAWADITLTHLDYTRNRWTDESDTPADPKTGSTDLLYTDFEIAFNHGGDNLFGADSGYRTGVMVEICGSLPAGKTFDPDKDYKAVTNYVNLASAITSQENPSFTTTYTYKTGKNRSVMAINIPTEKLTSQNRIEFGMPFTNACKEDGTHTNSKYLLKVTAFVRDKGENGVFDSDDNIVFSNSTYNCLDEIAGMELAVHGKDGIICEGV